MGLRRDLDEKRPIETGLAAKEELTSIHRSHSV